MNTVFNDRPLFECDILVSQVLLRFHLVADIPHLSSHMNRNLFHSVGARIHFGGIPGSNASTTIPSESRVLVRNGPACASVILKNERMPVHPK